MAKLTLKPLYKKLIVAASIVFILIMPLFVYNTRSPVLIVADISSIPLYGETRILSETRKASLALFRKVRAVTVADDASNDIIRFAIAEVSFRPYCVIFPLRFIHTARLYRENNPQVSVVLLIGRYDKEAVFFVTDGEPNDYFIYNTNVDDEFHRVVMAASALDMGKNGKIAVFTDQSALPQTRNAFLQAIDNLEIPLETVFFNSFSQFYEIPDLSCAVLAGTGIEFLENNQDIPVIFLTWIDPSLIPDNVVVVVDDSPWVQAVHAARMADARDADGQIKSKFIVNKKYIDKETLRKLKK
jgi:hypothetical protein